MKPEVHLNAVRFTPLLQTHCTHKLSPRSTAPTAAASSKPEPVFATAAFGGFSAPPLPPDAGPDEPGLGDGLLRELDVELDELEEVGDVVGVVVGSKVTEGEFVLNTPVPDGDGEDPGAEAGGVVTGAPPEGTMEMLGTGRSSASHELVS